jgi:signal transduction histidine kinase
MASERRVPIVGVMNRIVMTPCDLCFGEQINAEFLYEAERLTLNRDEIYCEIKTASEQMTDLLDSLRELSRGEGSISPRTASIDHTIRHAVDAVRARPEMRNREISIRTSGDMSGTFDPQKIERAFF